MTIIKWTGKSRYGSPRSYTYDSEQLQVIVICHDVLYVSYTMDNRSRMGQEEVPMAVDPDGGPYLGKGVRLYPPSPHSGLRIVKINKEKYEHAKKCLTVCVTVEEVGEEVKEEKEAKEEK